MLTSDFNFVLPPDRIAHAPAEPRDSSRLMVIDKKSKTFEHKHFYNLVDYLGPNDVVVWNNSKVFKARLHGRIFLDEETDDVPDDREAAIHPTDAILKEKIVEIFLVRPSENRGVWRVLAKPGKKLRLGYKVVFAPDFSCVVIAKENDGTVLVQFEDDAAGVRAKANRYGTVPTPPYIKNGAAALDGRGVLPYAPTDAFAPTGSSPLETSYQTVYAKTEGSVAAPTAGFHFTPALIEKLQQKGVQFIEITLHVGLGTFLPVKTTSVEEHKMHSEWVEISPDSAAALNQAKKDGKRIIAVGTTTVRTLEGVASIRGKIETYNDDLNIFIYPGYQFRVVDALITNFHLPESSLIMLVSAFAGDREFVLRCYQEAIQKKYRFYSFGDAMLIT